MPGYLLGSERASEKVRRIFRSLHVTGHHEQAGAAIQHGEVLGETRVDGVHHCLAYRVKRALGARLVAHG